MCISERNCFSDFDDDLTRQLEILPNLIQRIIFEIRKKHQVLIRYLMTEKIKLTILTFFFDKDTFHSPIKVSQDFL